MPEQKKQVFGLGLEAILDQKSFRELSRNLGKTLDTATDKWMREVDKDFANALVAGGRKGVFALSKTGEVKKFADEVFRFETMRDNIKAAIKAGDQDRAKSLQQQLRKETEMLNRLADRRKDAFDEVNKAQMRAIEEQVEAFGTGLHSAVSTVFGGDVKGFIDLLKGGAARGQRRGDALAHRGQQEGATGGQQAMGQLGKGIAGLAKSVATFAALAGGVVLLVKLFFDLESRSKELSKALLDTGGAASFGLGTGTKAGQQLQSELDKIKLQAAEAASEFSGLRASTKEHLEILSAYNEAGFTFRKMREEIDKGSESMQRYTDITNVALTYSKLLGKSATEIAADAGSYMSEQAVGIEQMAEAFSLVTREAQLSGFQTKRFYSTVLEVTTGMGQYNVRLEEAASLLRSLGGVLGQTVAPEFLKGIAGQGKESGYEDRLKNILVRGGGRVSGILGKAAGRTAGSLFERISKSGEGGKLLESMGITSGEDLSRLVGGQSAGQLQGFQTQLRNSGVSIELVNLLVGLQNQLKGAKGGRAAQMKALESAGPTANLALAMRPGGPFGGKLLHDIMDTATEPELIALKELTGMNESQLKEMADVTRNLEGGYNELQKFLNQDIGLEQKEQMAKLYGAYVEGNKILSARFDEQGRLLEGEGQEIRSIEDLIFNQQETQQDQADSVSEDVKLARRVAAATESTTKVLEENLAYWLELIYQKTRDIFSWLQWGGDNNAAAAVTQASKQLDEETKSLADELKQTKDQISKLTEQQKSEKDPLKRGALEDALTGLEAHLGRLEKAQEQRDLVKQELTGLNPADFNNAAELIAEAYKKAGIGGDTSALQKALADIEPEAGILDFSKGPQATVGRAREALSLVNHGISDQIIEGVLSELETALASVPQDEMDSFARTFLQRRLVEKAVGAEGVGGLLGGRESALAGLGSADATSGKISSLLDMYNMGGPQRDALQKELVHIAALMEKARSKALEEEAGQLLGTGSAFAEEEVARRILEGGGGLREARAASRGLEGLLKANDLYVPAGGKPIKLDRRDEVVASRPGGALSSMKGGRVVNININGGDTRMIFDVVRRVLNTN